MIEVVQSATFAKWLSKLDDRRARARVQVRIDRLALGNAGDVKPVGNGVSEMRIDYARLPALLPAAWADHRRPALRSNQTQPEN